MGALCETVMLRITINTDSETTRCKLEGKLAGAWVAELERSWHTELADSPRLVVDLAGVSYVDEAGKALLARMHARGAQLIAASCFTKSIVEEILHAACAAVLLLGFATGLRAQTPSTLRLTLREAVQLALQQNPQVQIANLNLAQSVQDRAITRSALLPQAALSASERVQRANIQALIGESFPGFPQHVGPYEVFQAGPGFSMPIFDLSLWRRWQASKS